MLNIHKHQKYYKNKLGKLFQDASLLKLHWWETICLKTTIFCNHWLMLQQQQQQESNVKSWWLSSVIPALGKLRQEDCYKCKTSTGHTVSSKPGWDTE